MNYQEPNWIKKLNLWQKIVVYSFILPFGICILLIQNEKFKNIIIKHRMLLIGVFLLFTLVNNPLIFWFLSVGLICYTTQQYYKNNAKIQPKLKLYYAFLTCFSLIVLLGFVSLVAQAIKNPIANNIENKKEVKGVNQAIKEDNIKNLELENIQFEKEKVEKNALITQAQSTNQDIDYEESQKGEPLLKKEDVINANLKIANFGNTTKDKRLFEVLSVVDGDTIKISELGTIRLIGIDTPETKDPRKKVQCFGEEATEFTKSSLLGKKVYLEFELNNRIDKYNRTLAYVFTENGNFFNLEIVKRGYAFAYTKYPNSKLDEFKNNEQQAREQNAGLWATNTCQGKLKDKVEQTPILTEVNTPLPVQQYNPPTPIPKAADEVAVKKSTNDICHAKGTTYYLKTSNFTSFKTIDDCINSGGRLPKR